MKKYQDKIYNKKREKVKRKITNNLGRVEETFFELICHVNVKKLKKSKDGSFTVSCFGIAKDKKLAKEYDLYKPITYVFDELNVNKSSLYINGYDDCKIIIRKSNISTIFILNVAGSCIIEDTIIDAYLYFSLASSELTLNNVEIKNRFQSKNLKVNTSIYSDNIIRVANSSIGDCNCNVSVNSNAFIFLVNSIISGININIDTKFINMDLNSQILALNNIDINTYLQDKLITNSKYLTINGKRIKKEEKEVILDTLIDPLHDKRYELYELLVALRDKCNSINSYKLNRYKNELDNSDITKVLKKV